MTPPLLEVENLSVHFTGRRSWFGAAPPPVRAVDDVSFTLAPREILGLVGESGSGKTTLARAILRLIPASMGCVRFEGRALQGLSQRALRPVRRRMQVVFQDPYASLNPRMTAGENVAEGLRLHGVGERRARAEMVALLLEQLGLPAEAAARYPHEFSGGQRQRIGIARALYHNPAILIMDEATAALDNETEREIVSVLETFRGEKTLITIAHRLTTIQRCDNLFFLSGGRIAASGSYRELEAGNPLFQRMIQAAKANADTL